MADYHDYVIKEGRFIGAFEEMYSDCADPWQQDSVVPIAEDVGLLLLARARYADVLDLGCGKGRFTGRLKAATKAAVTGLDVSPTAVKAAQERFPEVNFRASTIPPLDFPDASFDLATVSELLWYVLPKLETLFEEVARVLRPGGRLLIIQQFYDPAQQRYGREYLQKPEDLLRLVPLPNEQFIQVGRGDGYKAVLLFAKPV